MPECRTGVFGVLSPRTSMFAELFVENCRRVVGIKRRALPWMGSISDHPLCRDRFRVWIQAKSGLAEGLWLRVNALTGRDYCVGDNEPRVQEKIAKYLRPGTVFYDVGANMGYYSLAAARSVGGAGMVYAFDPDSRVHERLQENIRRNQFQNIRTVEAAAWVETGSVRFQKA